MYNIPLIAGKLVRGDIRDSLNKLKFMGNLEDFIETKHFLYSEFIIKGANSITIDYIKRVVELLK